MPLEYEYETLRRRAEERLGEEPEKNHGFDQKSSESLIHELRVHQIELEIQNDELRRVQRIVEENRKRYFDLFDTAPVGLVILDDTGIVKQFNRAFFEMIDQEALRSFNRGFADLLCEPDAEVFRARFKAILKNPRDKQLEVRLKLEEDEVRHVLLRSAFNEKPAAGPQEKDAGELIFTVEDISKQKQLEDELTSALDRLQILNKLLPICRQCNKIKKDNGTWERLTDHIQESTDKDHSQSVCPACSGKPAI